MAVCFLGGAKVAVIAAEMFSVAWNPVGSPAEWRRVYDVAPGAIVTHDLRVRDLGPGEQPLPNSERDGDWYVWRGARKSYPVVSFGSEPGSRNWRICTAEKCDTIADLTGLPEGADVTAIPCKAEAVPAK